MLHDQEISPRTVRKEQGTFPHIENTIIEPKQCMKMCSQDGMAPLAKSPKMKPFVILRDYPVSHENNDEEAVLRHRETCDLYRKWESMSNKFLIISFGEMKETHLSTNEDQINCEHKLGRNRKLPFDSYCRYMMIS